MAAKLRKGDKVYILAGKDKGKEGEITQIIGNDKAIVQGINIVKKHKSDFAFPSTTVYLNKWLKEVLLNLVE